MPAPRKVVGQSEPTDNSDSYQELRPNLEESLFTNFETAEQICCDNSRPSLERNGFPRVLYSTFQASMYFPVLRNAVASCSLGPRVLNNSREIIERVISWVRRRLLPDKIDLETTSTIITVSNSVAPDTSAVAEKTCRGKGDISLIFAKIFGSRHPSIIEKIPNPCLVLNR